MITAQQIIHAYERTQSLRESSRQLKIGLQVVRRVLITHDLYSTPLTIRIADFSKSGMTVDEIAEKLNIARSWVISNMPYTKGSYAVGEKTKNAIQIAKCRENKKIKEGEDIL